MRARGVAKLDATVEADGQGQGPVAAGRAGGDRDGGSGPDDPGRARGSARHTAQETIVPTASMALVEHLPISVIITDEAMNVLHTNLRAGRFLTTQSTLQMRDGGLATDDPAKTAFLHERVRRALRDPEGRSNVVVTSLNDRVSMQSLILRIFPIDYSWIGIDQQLPGEGLVAIMVEFGQISEAGARGLTETFGLSRSEFEILSALAHGKAPKEIATQRTSEVTTVRVHIRNLRAKMNCRTDNEAIILFHRFARF